MDLVRTKQIINILSLVTILVMMFGLYCSSAINEDIRNTADAIHSLFLPQVSTYDSYHYLYSE